MRVSQMRHDIISALRFRGAEMTTEDLAQMIPWSHRDEDEKARKARVLRALNKMEGHGAVSIDRSSRPFVITLLPLGYTAVGSFPPKGEKNDPRHGQRSAGSYGR